MRVILGYTEEGVSSFGEAFFRTVAERTLEECAVPFLRNKTIRLNAIAVSVEKIRELNRQYRNKDTATDILSFGEYAKKGELAETPDQEVFLGEIFFCPEYIEKMAREDEVMLKREMAYVFSHGVLHLVGYDHEEEMFAIQERVTDALAS